MQSELEASKTKLAEAEEAKAMCEEAAKEATAAATAAVEQAAASAGPNMHPIQPRSSNWFCRWCF